MLFHAGQIRRAGRVDDGTARTDYLDVERTRGISVRAATTALPWKEHLINLVDTPGHTDFAAEVERALRVIDGAVLILSAVEGVQAHTETLWHALRARGIPTLLFINKLDRNGADPHKVLEQVRTVLTNRCVVVQTVPATEHELHEVLPIDSADLLEQLAEWDEESLVRWVAGDSQAVERDPVMGRVGYVRLYSGELSVRDTVRVAGRPEPVRIVQIRKHLADRTLDISRIGTGDLAALCGLTGVRAGDVLADEDPHLGVDYLADVRELNLTVMGTVQVEVTQAVLQSRFGLTAHFDPPTVMYREAPVGVGEWESSYFLGNSYAILRFRIEPGPPGSGLTYVNETRHDKLRPQFEAEAARVGLETIQHGMSGWPVTDAVVTLVYGEHDEHLLVSTVGDYTICAPMAIMGALAQAGTRLLEPLYAFRLSVPEEAAGRVLGELAAMRATMEMPSSARGRLLVAGIVPVATSVAFGARLGGLAGGRGIWTTDPAGYQPAPPGTAAIRQRNGVNPLDTQRYLLHVRKAMR
ncbi:MAG: GTP-binding protein [Firmicutes bacterium]|nr:GTP-binding protein [Bacillota bacterium]